MPALGSSVASAHGAAGPIQLRPGGHRYAVLLCTVLATFFWPVACGESRRVEPRGGSTEDRTVLDVELECTLQGGVELCRLGGRFEFEGRGVEQRGAGDVGGHPLVQVVEGGGLGKMVTPGVDRLTGQQVFLKCRPTNAGGQGTVAGARAWRGEEAERAVAGSLHILSPHITLNVAASGVGSAGTGKGAPATCSVYARAQGSVSELLAAPGALSPQDAIAVIRAVRAGIATMHEKGFAHRDIKHRNVLFFPEAQGEGRFRLADLDAAAVLGEEITEFMGMPWEVWVPNVQIGPWPTAVPSPEHARHLHSRWSLAAVPPLLASREADWFQFGVLILEVICYRPVLAGRPGREVLADLAAQGPLRVPECSAASRLGEACAVSLQALAGALLSKNASARPGALDSLAALRPCLPAPSRLHEHADRGGDGRAAGRAAEVAEDGEGAGVAGGIGSAGGAGECFRVRWPAR